MKNKLFLIFFSLLLLQATGKAQQLKVNYVKAFQNINHPEVAYWFFTGNMLPESGWKGKIDRFARYSKYTLIFLTERNGCDFYDFKTMHSIFKKLVAHAHHKGLKIGLQLWKNDKKTLVENTNRLMQEGEVVLDENGHADYSVTAKGARNMSGLIKSELFKIYAFKKTADGFYDASTLRDITKLAKADTTGTSTPIQMGIGMTNIVSLQKDSAVTFSFIYNRYTFKGIYKSLAAIKVDHKGNLQKLAATGFVSLERNGLDGSIYNKNYITHNGLVFEMSPTSNYSRGISLESFPYSFSNGK